jgi:phosphate:Na+ symporter
MSIFGLLNIILGFALFLYGTEVMGKSLSAVSGRQLEPRLRIFGAAAIVWIFGLISVAGQNPLVMLFRPSVFAPPFAAVGIVVFISAKSNRRKNIGQIFLSFAVMLLGLSFAGENIKPLYDIPAIAPVVRVFTNPLLVFLMGALLLPLLFFADRLKRFFRPHDADSAETAKEAVAITGLDVRFLGTPTFALEQARSATIDMAGYAKETVVTAFGLLFSYDKKKGERVEELEEAIDQYEDRVGAYLLKIGTQQLSPQDSHALAVLLHTVGDIERVSDLALSVKKNAREMKDNDLRFTETSVSELKKLTSAVNDIVNTAFLAFQEEDQQLARMVEPLATVIESLRDKMRKSQVKQLRKGLCSMELSFICTDVIASCGYIADHCANIAIGMLQNEDSFETHEYSRLIRLEDNGEFAGEVKRLKKLYKI